ncbi:hypothetical protein CYMTET_14359 [Cymbomonas tetramitiformis]|uniref:Right handed beta helix domain-containing protein n=1 Tax=Cymbomonas tetramitiformis TaxID=36881 RepID=A0AAE0GGH4_9CHLO|nr:hypothetical protein CYMTET_14359 [Cymbomonas tetramitiformis]
MKGSGRFPQGMVYDSMGVHPIAGKVSHAEAESISARAPRGKDLLRNSDYNLDTPSQGSERGDISAVAPRRLLDTEYTLFFSGYAEGSGNNKLVQLFNPSCSDAALEEYTLQKTINGGDPSEHPLSGTLRAGQLATFCYTGFESFECTEYDTFFSFNGDDALALFHNDVQVDSIGVLGEDPGSGWAVAETAAATKDHTIVRKAEVVGGEVDWSVSAGTSAADSEWVVYLKDDVDVLLCFTTSQACGHEDQELEVCGGGSQPPAPSPPSLTPSPPIAPPLLPLVRQGPSSPSHPTPPLRPPFSPLAPSTSTVAVVNSTSPTESAVELDSAINTFNIELVEIYTRVQLDSVLPTVTRKLQLQGMGGQHAIDGVYRTQLLVVGRGGNLTLTNLALVNGYASQGGAVAVQVGGRLAVSGCLLSHHYASAEGGAVYLESGEAVDIVLAATEMHNNSAAQGAGLVHVDDLGGGQLVVQDSYLHDHEGKYSLLVLGGCGAVRISGSSTWRNTATESGALAAWSTCAGGGTLTVEDSVISEHRSSEYGGVLNFAFFEGGSVAFMRSSLVGNSAGLSGGVLGAYSCAELKIVVEDTIMENNTADNQGGVFQLTYGSDSLVVENSAFRYNVAGQDGGAVYFRFAGDISVTGSTLSGNIVDPDATLNSGLGGAIFMEESGALKVEAGSEMDGNSGNEGGALYMLLSGGLTLADCQMTDNIARNKGGAVWVDGSKGNVTVEGCTATGNQAEQGGVIGVWNTDTSLQVRRSTLNSNSAASVGGAIYVESKYAGLAGVELEQLEMNDNAAGSGAALHARGSVKYATTMTECSVARSLGAAVEVTGDLTVVACTFTSNAAAAEGGAVLLGESGMGSVLFGDGCLFENNSAVKMGGAVYGSRSAGATAELQLAACHFLGNAAANGGGAVSWEATSDVTSLVVDSVFTNNTVTGSAEGGGALLVTGGQGLVVNRSQLSSNNVAEMQGGALYWVSQDSSLRISGTQIDQNSASKGGGVACYGSDDRTGADTITFEMLSGTVVADNTAEDGGGILLSSGLSGRVAEASIVTGNVASDEGGGIRLERDGSLLLEEDTAVLLNVAQKGAGISAPDGVNVTLSGARVEHNQAGSYTAGIAVGSESTVVLEKASSVSNNSASADGGAGGISVGEYSKVVINQTSVVAGNIGGDGGGVSGSDYCVVIVDEGSSVSANQARQGGGISVGAHPVLLVDHQSFIEENFAEGSGGGIFASTDAIIEVLQGSRISLNTGNEGGGIYVNTGSLLTLRNLSEVANNTAENSGGGVHIFGSSTMDAAENCSICHNIAGNSGGGVYSMSGIVKLDWCVVESNYAHNEGAGIAALDSAEVTLTYTSVAGNLARRFNGGGCLRRRPAT